MTSFDDDAMWRSSHVEKVEVNNSLLCLLRFMSAFVSLYILLGFSSVSRVGILYFINT